MSLINSTNKKIEDCEFHLSINLKQRQSFNNDKNHCDDDEMVIVGDFKENLRIKRSGTNSDWIQFLFKTTNFMPLWFAVYRGHNNSNNINHKSHFNYLSNTLSHDSYFVINCLRDLFTHHLFVDENVNLNKVKFWFDCGNHFGNCELLKYFDH